MPDIKPEDMTHDQLQDYLDAMMDLPDYDEEEYFRLETLCLEKLTNMGKERREKIKEEREENIEAAKEALSSCGPLFKSCALWACAIALFLGLVVTGAVYLIRGM